MHKDYTINSDIMLVVENRGIYVFDEAQLNRQAIDGKSKRAKVVFSCSIYRTRISG